MDYIYLFKHKTSKVNKNKIGLYTLITAYYFMKKGCIDYNKIDLCVEQVFKATECMIDDLAQLKTLTDITNDIKLLDSVILTIDKLEEIFDCKKRYVYIFFNTNGDNSKYILVCHDNSIFHVIDFKKNQQYDFARCRDVSNYLINEYQICHMNHNKIYLSSEFKLEHIWQYLEITDKFDFDYAHLTESIVTPTPIVMHSIYENEIIDDDIYEDGIYEDDLNE